MNLRSPELEVFLPVSQLVYTSARAYGSNSITIPDGWYWLFHIQKVHTQPPIHVQSEDGKPRRKSTNHSMPHFVSDILHTNDG